MAGQTEDPSGGVPPPTGEVTQLLKNLREQNNTRDFDRLLALVYQDLRRLAANFMRRERSTHTLQTTALVHEAYIRLVDQEKADWEDRTHFMRIAATMMRRILVDHARKYKTGKRGSDVARVPIDVEALELPMTEQACDLVLALDQVFPRFERQYPQKSQVIALRFFGGLSVEETANILNVSPRTVVRDSHFARAWLMDEIASLA